MLGGRLPGVAIGWSNGARGGGSPWVAMTTGLEAPEKEHTK